VETLTPSNIWVGRKEDMSTTGRLRLMRQEDGDMCVAIVDERGRVASVEFCTTMRGGGRSPRTFAALRALAQAIVEDNADDPDRMAHR
jgi:ribosomal protein S9